MEAEGFHPVDQARQAIITEGLGVRSQQRLSQDLQIGDEGLGPAVGLGLEAGRTRRRGTDLGLIVGGQARIDAGQGPAERLARLVGRGVARRRRQGGQLGGEVDQGIGQAELGPERMDIVQIGAQRRLRLGAEGGLHDVGVDIGIAVAIAAYPAADLEEGLEVRRIQPVAPGIQMLGHGLEEHLFEEGDHSVDLVLHHQTRGADQSRGPQEEDLPAQGAAGPLSLATSVQQGGEGGNAVQHTLAPHLGRVGRQHRRNQPFRQNIDHGLAVRTAARQPGQRGLGRGGGLVRRRRLRLGHRLLRAEARQQALHFGDVPGVRAVAVIGDRGPADRLDPVVQILPPGLADDIPQHGAQQADLLAQAVGRQGIGGQGVGHEVSLKIDDRRANRRGDR